VPFHRSKEKFLALKGILFVSAFIIGRIWVSQWAKALEVGLIGRNHNLIGQFLKGLKVERTQKKQKKGVLSKWMCREKGVQQEYGKKKKGGIELTSGTTKLMAISSREEERTEDSGA